MEAHICIVAWDADNRVAKYQDFASAAEAEAHKAGVIDRYPGAFVAANPGGGSRQWLVDGETLVFSPPPEPPPPTDEERIDEAFPQTDVARVLFEAFFEIANRLQALEGKQPVTKAQLKAWLKAKLP